MGSFLNDTERAAFLKAVGPLMEWLNTNPTKVNPYTQVIVDMNEAKIYTHEITVQDNQYLRD